MEAVMTRLVLCGIALIGSSVAFAQPPAPSETGAPPRTITLTGCVGGGGATAQSITLTSAMVIPTTEQAGAVMPSPVPAPVSPTPTQPTTAPGAAGRAGTAGTAEMPATAGMSGTAGTVGTSGTIVAGTAPAGSSGSSASGYRLSGTDMSVWMGRRVQIVGSLVPAAPGGAPTSAAAIGATRIGLDGAPILPEFRVLSVSPVTGDCPR